MALRCTWWLHVGGHRRRSHWRLLGVSEQVSPYELRSSCERMLIVAVACECMLTGILRASLAARSECQCPPDPSARPLPSVTWVTWVTWQRRPLAKRPPGDGRAVGWLVREASGGLRSRPPFTGDRVSMHSQLTWPARRVEDLDLILRSSPLPDLWRGEGSRWALTRARALPLPDLRRRRVRHVCRSHEVSVSVTRRVAGMHGDHTAVMRPPPA